VSDDKKMTFVDLQAHSQEDLVAREKTLRTQLFEHRMARFTNQIEDTMKIRKTRREIARVHTVLSARKGAAKGKE
jgi:ribosomal protein L29